MRTKSMLGMGLLLVAACATESLDDDLVVSGGAGKADGDGDWSVTARKGNTMLGHAVAAADINGDGRQDLVIGAPGVAKVHVYLATDAALESQPAATVAGPTAFGRRLTRLARPTDGDCFAVVARAQPNVSVYCGEQPSPAWSSEGTLTGERSALWSVASGDVNDDGIDDLAIASDANVWVVLGAAKGYARTPAWSVSLAATQLALGDIDGDGKDELAIGTGDSVHIYAGSAQGLSATPALRIAAPAGAAAFGRSLALGDLDSDDRADLAIGYTVASRGRVDVHLGAGSGLNLGPPIVELAEAGASTLTHFGRSIAITNFGADSFGDLLVTEAGQLHMYAFVHDAYDAPTWRKTIDDADGSFGAALAIANLVGGQNPDIIVGEPELAVASGGGTAFNAGRVSVIDGAALGFAR